MRSMCGQSVYIIRALISAVIVAAVCAEHDTADAWNGGGDGAKVHGTGAHFEASSTAKIVSHSLHRRRHHHRTHPNASGPGLGGAAAPVHNYAPHKVAHHQSHDDAVLHRIPGKHSALTHHARTDDAGARHHADRLEAPKFHQPQHGHGQHQPRQPHQAVHQQPGHGQHAQHSNNNHHGPHQPRTHSEARHEMTTQNPFRAPAPTLPHARHGGRWESGRNLATLTTTTTTLAPAVGRLNSNAFERSAAIDDDDDYFDEGVNNVIGDDDDLDDDDDEAYDDDDADEEDNAINEVDVANAYGRGARQQSDKEKSRVKAEKLSRPALDEPFNHDYQSDMPYFDTSYGDEDNGRYLSANGYQADEPVRNNRFNAADPVRNTLNGIYSVSLSIFSGTISCYREELDEFVPSAAAIFI